MENFVDAVFVAPNKVVFSASYSKSGLSNKLKLFSRMSTTRAKNLSKESRYTVSLIHVRVALICSCGKR